jgi:2-dehydropantoate 2-reductase
VGPVDVLIQSVKLYDLDTATRQMLPMVGPGTMVLTMQNGVTAPDEVGEIVGRQHVIGGVTFMNSIVTAPGVISSKSEMNTIVFGELDGTPSDRVVSFQQVCLKAGIDAKVSPDIRAEQWRKFIPVAGLSALSSLTRQPLGPVRDDPPLRALYRQAMDEVAALAKAKGVALEPDIVERMLALAARYKYDAKVSMLEDLEAGKPLELEWLSGYVSREAARLGVPAAFHDIAYACLRPLNKSKRP